MRQQFIAAIVVVPALRTGERPTRMVTWCQEGKHNPRHIVQDVLGKFVGEDGAKVVAQCYAAAHKVPTCWPKPTVLS